MKTCTFFGTTTAHLSWTKNFWYKPLLLLSSTYWPFSLWKILKNSNNRSRVMTIHHFWAQSAPFSPNNFFFLENYYHHSHLRISPFHCAKLKKNSSSRSVMRICNLWVQNGPFSQIRMFFRKPVNQPCLFYSCLSTCQKSNSEINLLVKYWWLKNTEISLAESHFCL